MAVEIKLTGFKELEAAFKQLGPKLEKKGLRSANYAGAQIVVQAAKRTSAFQDKTGALRAAIWAYKRRTADNIVTHAVAVKGLSSKIKRERRKQKRAGIAVAKLPAGPAIYGKFLEFGTSKMSARPFLRPAFLANVDNVIDTIRSGLQTAITKGIKK